MKHILLIIGLLAFVICGGCENTATILHGTDPGCRDASDCDAGQVCVNGECQDWQPQSDGDTEIDNDPDIDITDPEPEGDMEDPADGDEDRPAEAEEETDVDESPLPDGDLEEDEPIIIDGDIDPPEVDCHITGTGKVLSLEPLSWSIDFGSVLLGEVEVRYLTVCNAGTEEFNVTNIMQRQGDSSEFQMQSDTMPITLEPGEGTLVALLYEPRDYGEDHGVVEIQSDSETPQVDVAVHGQASSLGFLQVRPQVLQFRNQSGRGVVALDNIGVAPVILESIEVQPGLHFSVHSLDPGGDTGPWTMDPGHFHNLYIDFDGDVTAPDESCVLRWSTGGVAMETTVTLQAGDTVVCAEPDAGPDQTVTPLATVQLDGSASADPNDWQGQGEEWFQWTMAQKPEGATGAVLLDRTARPIGGQWSSESSPTFYAELAGLYVVELRINPDDDIGCIVTDTVNIMVVPGNTIHIQARWNEADCDLDLHLIRHSVEGQTDAPGCFTHSDSSNVNDCHWTNCNTRNKTAFPCPPRGCPGPSDAPDWGDTGSRHDDPTLDIDDIPGTGPEELNLSLPAMGDYFVALERYSGSSTPEATVKIWLFGVLQATFSDVSIPTTHHHWNVCWIKVHSAADIELVPIGRIKDSGDGTTRDCYPEEGGVPAGQ